MTFRGLHLPNIESSGNARWAHCFWIFLSLLCCLPISGRAQSALQHFSVMTYNVENAFDTIPSTTSDDRDFLPSGQQRWTRWRYAQKLRHIAQVMLAADTLHPVDLVVLQEVESDSVIHDLLQHTILASLHYEAVKTHSSDERGINVAIVYSPYTFHPVSHDSIRLDASSGITTRDILHLAGTIPTGDTLDVYAVHLPSRLGGAAALQARRQLIGQLKQHVDSVSVHRAQPYILVAGDFNAAPEAKELTQLAGSDPSSLQDLTNLMAGRKWGSYKFQGQWEWIDQIWASALLLRQEGTLTADLSTLRTLELPWLLEPDTSYGGQKPFRTFLGPRYHGGYSDHLPVVIQLRMR